MDPLEQSLQLLDKACAIIQELVAQLQAKGQEGQMDKKAEELALKSGVSFNEASDMIKTAGENGSSVDLLLKAAEMMKRNQPFGKVADDESNQISKTGSIATDKFLEKQAELMDELGIF